MNKEEDSNLLPEWIQERLAAYRQQATEFEQWPQTADPLMTLLTQSVQPSSFDERDDHMLSLVINDAIAGIDIVQRYPSFFEKMADSPELYQAFLDGLDLLEADKAEALIPLPHTSSQDLSFLEKIQEWRASVTQATDGGWLLTWQLVGEQIRQILFPSPNLAYRRASGLLEDESFIVLHDGVTVSGQVVEVMLEAVWPVERPEALYLQVLVASEGSSAGMQASLHWGRYAATAVLNQYGRAQFPPFPLDDILDDAGQLNAGDLQLVLTLPQAD